MAKTMEGPKDILPETPWDDETSSEDQEGSSDENSSSDDEQQQHASDDDDDESEYDEPVVKASKPLSKGAINGKRPAVNEPEKINKFSNKSKKTKGSDEQVDKGKGVVHFDKSKNGIVDDQIEEKKGKDKNEESEDYWSLYPFLCASLESDASTYSTVMMIRDIKEHVKEVIREMGEDKARQLEDEWKAVRAMDRQLHVRWAELIAKQAQLGVDSFKS